MERLEPFADLSIIDRFASKFGLDPDQVYTGKSFDTVINFAWLWKEQHEYQERYGEIQQMMQESNEKVK